MTDVVVTGAGGYVGQRLCAGLTGSEGVTLRRLPRSDFEAWFCADQPSAAGIDFLRSADAIVHLAAMPELDCEKNPEQALLRNGLATLRLADAAAIAGVRRFVYTSTIKVLGTTLSGVIDETTPVNPPSQYSLSKYVGERYVLAGHRAGRFSAAVLRFSNIVGAPSANASPAVWKLIGNDFCRQALRSRCIVIKSSGLQWRNWLPMEDAVGALTRALNADTTKLDNGLFNLGGTTSCTLLDFARLVAERAAMMLGAPVTIETLSDQPPLTAGPLSLDLARSQNAGFYTVTPLAWSVDQTLAHVAQMDAVQ